MVKSASTALRATFLLVVAGFVVYLGSRSRSEETDPVNKPDMPKRWDVVYEFDFTHYVYIENAIAGDRQMYDSPIREICGSTNNYCYIQFWSDRAKVPRHTGLLTEREAAAVIAAYSHNPSTGDTSLLLSCKLDPDRSRCFTP